MDRSVEMLRFFRQLAKPLRLSIVELIQMDHFPPLGMEVEDSCEDAPSRICCSGWLVAIPPTCRISETGHRKGYEIPAANSGQR